MLPAWPVSPETLHYMERKHSPHVFFPIQCRVSIKSEISMVILRGRSFAQARGLGVDDVTRAGYPHPHGGRCRRDTCACRAGNATVTSPEPPCRCPPWRTPERLDSHTGQL